MSALAVFVFGVLVGVMVFWLIFSVYWRRWRGYLMRDMVHLQAKVKSVEATNIGLERQMAAQKTDLTGMRSKINALETENRLARARIEGCEAEKQALSEHLSTLRGELASYKSLVTEPAITHLPALKPANGNGNGHAKPPVNGNGAAGKPPAAKELPAAERLSAAERLLAAKPNGNGHATAQSKKTPAEESLEALFALSQDVVSTPVNGSVSKNGHTNGTMTAPAWGRRLPDLPPDQVITPDIIIARPRMGGDRLEIIQGVGPAMIKKLDNAGIDSFRLLAAQTPERLKEIIGPRLARLADVNSIINQAKRIVGE